MAMKEDMPSLSYRRDVVKDFRSFASIDARLLLKWHDFLNSC